MAKWRFGRERGGGGSGTFILEEEHYRSCLISGGMKNYGPSGGIPVCRNGSCVESPFSKLIKTNVDIISLQHTKPNDPETFLFQNKH